MRKKEGLPLFFPSRLFVYWNERKIEHTVDSDAGAEIRDGMKVIAKTGACSENGKSHEPKGALWPYVIGKFREQPPAACFDDAKKDMAVEYSRVPQTLTSSPRRASSPCRGPRSSRWAATRS